MKTIKSKAVEVICRANCLQETDVVCILEARVHVIEDWYFYGFSLKGKGIWCFYWCDRHEEIFPDDIIYFTNYASYCEYVNTRMIYTI